MRWGVSAFLISMISAGSLFFICRGKGIGLQVFLVVFLPLMVSIAWYWTPQILGIYSGDQAWSWSGLFIWTWYGCALLASIVGCIASSKFSKGR